MTASPHALLVRPMRIGLVIAAVDDWSVQAVAAAQTLAERSSQLTFTTLRADLPGIDSIRAFDLRLDAVITRLGDPALVEALAAYGLPTVNLSTRPVGLPSVWFDEPELGRLGCRHLIEQGAEQVIMLRWPQPGRIWDGRQGGAEEVCHAHGVPFDAAKVRRPADIERVLARAQPRTGIFCANDILGQWTLRHAADLRIGIPETCLVIGVDDSHDLCPFTRPALSSVRLDFATLLSGAIRLLDAMLAGMPAPELPSPSGEVTVRESTRKVDGDPLQDALACIRSHKQRNPSLDEIARAAEIHPRALQRLFRQRLGESPHAVVVRERMALARSLLADSEQTIAAIAAACGYASQQRFAAAFRESTGESPSEFRRHLGG